jgi:hypothetical protein
LIDSKTALDAPLGALRTEHEREHAVANLITIPRVYSLALVAFLVLSRWFVAPSYLYYFDSANFALALENFNPALHQPQPPGYPLFVGLTRLIDFALDDPQQIMLVAGLAGGIAAVLALLYLGMLMYGRNAGILAAALLASDPVFWFGGVTNEVRIYLSLGMAAVCLCAWRALLAPERAGRLYLLFAVIGLAAGFRPIETWLLMPLALWVWWRTGKSPARLARGCAATLATTLPWLSAILWQTGGPRRFLTIVRDYANSQFEGSSALFGAQNFAASAMFLKAVVWTTLGTVVWVWAIPFIVRGPRPRWSMRATFLSLAFLPPFLFAAVVHVGDPDQALAGVTILSLIGGAVLARLLANAAASRIYIAAALVAVAHASDFYHPRLHMGEAASYGSVRNVDRMTSEAIGAIRALHRDGPVTIVHFGSPVTFRQIAWYFPTDVVHALPGSPQQAAVGPVFSYLRHQQIPAPEGAAARIGALSKRLICLVPRDTPETALPGWKRRGPVFVLDNIPEGGVKIGEFRLIW